MSTQPVTMGVDWPEIWCLMEVFVMFDICTYCLFYFVRQHRQGSGFHEIGFIILPVVQRLAVSRRWWGVTCKRKEQKKMWFS